MTINDLKISFLIPSKRGAKFLNDTVGSIIRTAININTIEIMVKVDSIQEKNDYEQFFESKNYSCKICIIYDDSSDFTNNAHFYNLLATHSNGDLLWVFSDDFIIQTSNWQPQFVNIVNQYPDMIFAINHRHHGWSFAPVCTRKWFKTVGYISKWYHGDAWIKQVAKKIKRYIQVPEEIQIVHITHNKTHSPLEKKQRRRFKEEMDRASVVVAHKLRSMKN